MDKDKVLLEDVEEFIEERLNQSYSDLKNNSEYVKLEEEYDAIFKKLTENIEENKIVEEYEKIKIDMYEMQLKQAYRSGFKDSIYLIFNK